METDCTSTCVSSATWSKYHILSSIAFLPQKGGTPCIKIVRLCISDSTELRLALRRVLLVSKVRIWGAMLLATCEWISAKAGPTTVEWYSWNASLMVSLPISGGCVELEGAWGRGTSVVIENCPRLGSRRASFLGRRVAINTFIAPGSAWSLCTSSGSMSPQERGSSSSDLTDRKSVMLEEIEICDCTLC